MFLLGLSVVRSLAVTTAATLFDARAKAPAAASGTTPSPAPRAPPSAARHLDVDRGDAFSAGLMHDVGEALVRRHAPAEFAEIARQVAIAPTERLAVEKAFLQGLSHTDVGAALAGWGLPDRLVAAIRHHHDEVDHDAAPLTLAVVAGDAIADALLEDESPHQAARGLDACLAAAKIRRTATSRSSTRWPRRPTTSATPSAASRLVRTGGATALPHSAIRAPAPGPTERLAGQRPGMSGGEKSGGPLGAGPCEAERAP